MNQEVATIRDHPTVKDAVLIDVPPTANAIMARFQSARFNREQRAFILSASMYGRFVEFAVTEGLIINDIRTTVVQHSGPRPLPQECRNCGQPGSLTNPPIHCPACGNAWDPITPHDIDFADPITKTQCTVCKHFNEGKFEFCAKCGAPMAYSASTNPPLDFRQAGVQCPKCKHVNVKGEAYCGQCDEPLPDFVLGAESVDRQGEPGLIGDVLGQVIRNVPDLDGERIFSKADWLAYRAFWRTIPSNVARYRPEIERWHEAGRPADWAAWLRSAGRSTAQEAAAPGSESASKPSTNSEASGASTAHDFAEWDEILPDEDES